MSDKIDNMPDPNQTPCPAECEAREHIQLAVQLLKGLSAEHARVAWVIEDSLMLLDEIRQEPGRPVLSLDQIGNQTPEVSKFLGRSGN